MIYITGDVHGLKDIDKFTSVFFQNQVNKKGNYIIITGDFGITWNKEILAKCKKFYDKFDCKVLFIDGNNENFDILNKMPVVKYCGGKAHKISNNIYHLMRGEIFEIENYKFLAFGGADSWDAPFRYSGTSRVEGKSFWKMECPTKQEFENALNNLKKNNFKVDFVLTHEGTSQMAQYFHSLIDNVCHMNDTIFKLTNYRYWFFGHHHSNKAFENNMRCIYNDFDCVDNYLKVDFVKNKQENLDQTL